MASSRRWTSTRRTTSSRRAKARKPKDTRVRHGGHGFREVNAPKRLY